MRAGRRLPLFLAVWILTAGAWAQDEAVTFCAYNLKNWLRMQPPAGRAAASEGQDKPEREKRLVVDFMRQIRPDILGVCEIGTPDDLADLQARLKAAGLDLPHTEFNQGADPARSLALLSRHPILRRDSRGALPYQLEGETLRFQRGILDATVAVSADLEVRFLGVHLKSKREVAEADQALMRRNEAHLTRLHLDSIFAGQPRPKLVLYGDFNEHRNEPAILEIIGSRAQEGYMIELPVRDRHGLLWTHFWDAADVYSRIDYLFVSRELRPHVDLKHSHVFASDDFDKASDHRPLVLSLRPRR